MRKIIFLMYICLVANASFAQDVAMINKSTSTKNVPLAGNVSSKNEEPHYVFEIYGDIPVTHSTFNEKHFLGGLATEKWNTFLCNYTHEYKNSVGLSGSLTEISKPAIYNAVMKANKFVKNALKKNSISSKDAIAQICHMFDCANVICTESDTKKIENDLEKIKNGQDILTFFNKVELKKM